MFTFIMAGSFNTTVALWGAYYYSFLVIVFNQTITQATYIQNIYTVASCFWAMALGIASGSTVESNGIYLRLSLVLPGGESLRTLSEPRYG